MILVGDIGATSGQWRRIARDQKISQFTTPGFNAAHGHMTDFVTTVKSTLQTLGDCEKMYLYVAGLLPEGNALFVRELQASFPLINIEVASDMIGAARGLAGNEPSWIGILGTGANLAYFDGANLSNRRPSLGYILGDEGSGSYMGKRLLVDYLRGDMPTEFKKIFESTFQLTESDIIQLVYDSQKAKVFLAGFTPFLNEQLAYPYSYQLVYNCFNDHFDALLPLQYNAGEPIHYAGSVALAFSDLLRHVARDKDIALGRIVGSPIAGLALYHQEEIAK